MTQASPASGSTSSSLLARVRSKHPEAWSRFAALYSPLVYGWVRRAGLQDADAMDVVQDVFCSVFTKIGHFQQQGQSSRFRNWLWAITRNRIRLYYRQAAGQTQATGGSDGKLRLEQYRDLLDGDADPTDPHSRAAFVQRALLLARKDFSEPTWQAFWRMAIEGHPAAEVAGELGMSPSSVRQAKYRVLCRLRDELHGF